MPKLLTVKEAAEALRVAPRSIYRYIDDGKLAVVQVGRKLLISEESLSELLTPAPRPRGDTEHA